VFAVFARVDLGQQLACASDWLTLHVLTMREVIESDQENGSDYKDEDCAQPCRTPDIDEALIVVATADPAKPFPGCLVPSRSSLRCSELADQVVRYVNASFYNARGLVITLPNLNDVIVRTTYVIVAILIAIAESCNVGPSVEFNPPCRFAIVEATTY